MRMIIIASFLLLSSCDNYCEIYFFKQEFYSSPGIKCEEVESIMGVSLLEIRSTDSLNSIVKTIDKYNFLIEKYSSSITIKIINNGSIYCSNLDLLLQLDQDIESGDYMKLKALKRILDKEKDKARVLIPFKTK